MTSGATAQTFETLPEDQQVGFCTTYYMTMAERDGGTDQFRALSAGFLTISARVSGKSAEVLEPILAQGIPMLTPILDTVETDANSKQMADMSQEFCTALSAKYDETKDLSE